SDDLYRMISSLKLCREILKQPPLSTVNNVKESGFNDDMSDEDWKGLFRIIRKGISSHQLAKDTGITQK
ncbi:4363_t:CDS:2, partial [Gigaspora margarita]